MMLGREGSHDAREGGGDHMMLGRGGSHDAREGGGGSHDAQMHKE